MEMISAKEAAKIATSIETAIHDKQLKEINNLIVEAANKGKLLIYIGYYPSEPVKLKLQSLGYGVSSNNSRNETTTTISWNPKEMFSNGGYR